MAYKNLEDKSVEHQKAVAIGLEILDIAEDIMLQSDLRTGTRGNAIRLAIESYRIVTGSN